jgi:glyoxylase-like metal-dependent hydrolase (beta-lactamase superfamily II)
LIRTQAESPPRGGGNQPLGSIQEQVIGVSGPYAWNQLGTLAVIPTEGTRLLPMPSRTPDPTAVPDQAEQRRLLLWLTPQGFVKSALTHHATLSTKIERRHRMTTITFELEGGVQVEGTANEQNLVERIVTHVPHPVLGDMLVEFVYANYRDFGGIPFPTTILVKQGGFHALEVSVADAVINPEEHTVEVPRQARVTHVPVPPVSAQSLAEGLWFLSGGSQNSVAVEFRDFAVVIEAPENEEHSLAMIAKVKELMPRKAIRYLVNTHHHFDQAGGLRTYAAEGAAILTHASNHQFYDLLFTAERKLRPDRFSQSNRTPRVELVGDYHVIRNGSRVLEIHHVAGSMHDAGLLMVYLPRERLLVESHVFTPGEPGAPLAPNPFTLNLYENVMRLNLGVTRIAPIYGRMVPWSELLKAIGRPADDTPADGLLRAVAQL